MGAQNYHFRKSPKKLGLFAIFYAPKNQQNKVQLSDTQTTLQFASDLEEKF